MKKIIALITMFVLSAGFLMAQGVFTYQAVVYDNQTHVLVVDQDVTATVTITDGTHNYNQTTPVHTSLNGLATIPVGINDEPDFETGFEQMDWSAATIKVDFAVSGSQLTGQTEQIPAVPYALQSDTKLTTQMIKDYISSADYDEDIDLLLSIAKQNGTLYDDVLASIVNDIKDNYQLAKEIFMSYLQQADAQDAKQLFDSLAKNQPVVDKLIEILSDTLKTSDGKEIVFDILSAYAMQLTVADVNAIWNAIPANVKKEVVKQAFEFVLVDNNGQYTLNEDVRTYLIVPVVMDYVEHITTGEVQQLIDAVVNNNNTDDSHGNNTTFDIVLDKFYEWMDYYFANRYSGGSTSNIDEIVSNTIQENYYAQCSPAIDLCGLYETLQEINTPDCFTLTNGSSFVFAEPNAQDKYVGTIYYSGSNVSFSNIPSMVHVEYKMNGGAPSNLDIPAQCFNINTSVPNQITFSIDHNSVWGATSIFATDGDYFTATFTFTVTDNTEGCTNTPTNITFTGTYTYTEPCLVTEESFEKENNFYTGHVFFKGTMSLDNITYFKMNYVANGPDQQGGETGSENIGPDMTQYKANYITIDNEYHTLTVRIPVSEISAWFNNHLSPEAQDCNYQIRINGLNCLNAAEDVFIYLNYDQQ